VQLLTILQNISQASDRWGRDRAETIIANHRARLFTSGIGDRATLDYLRQTLGEEEINRISTHRNTALATGSRTYSSEFRSLAAPHRVRQADTNTALLIYGRLQPAWLNLRPWYAHRQLRELVTAAATATANPERTVSPARPRIHPRHEPGEKASHDPVSDTPRTQHRASTRRRVSCSRLLAAVAGRVLPGPGFSPRPAWASKPCGLSPRYCSAPPAAPRPITALSNHTNHHRKDTR